MEKIAIISDVHGNITALNAVLSDIKKRHIEKIFCLGDYVIKCTHPDLVIDKLREVCEVMLIGNSDYAICRPEAKDKKFWSREKIGEERANFIYNLPVFHEFYMSGHLIRLFHASPYGLDNIYNPMFSNKGTQYAGTELKGPEDLFKNTEFIGKTSKDPEPDIVGYGHIHTPCLVRYKNKTLFNTGSVGIPVEMMNSDVDDKSNKFSTLASYIIIEGNYNSKELDSISFNLVRIPYNIQKEIDDNQRIYYGLETNSIVVTNTKNKEEYDYTDSEGEEHTYSYEGKSGIQVGFLDRLILAVRNKDFKLAFSTSVTNQSKILTNRNVIERAKTALPYLLYDENAYTVIKDNQIYWVIDAYTISDKYPYSSYTTIDGEKEKRDINYIRNSVKVIINAYNGEMKFYIVDKTDPIISAYKKIYPAMFEENDIPEEIQKQLKYPQLLYNVQAEMLRVYHNVKEDVLYRKSDIWSLATYGKSTSKTKTATLEPYYTMLKTPDGETRFGLVQMYTQKNKTNIISYVLGTCNGTSNELKIYKFSADSNILGANQLDNLIEQDETISAELNSLNVTGVKISKEMKIIPINNTLLYIETIYQTKTNEINQPITLEKVIVASGTKVAIGDNLENALSKLLSQSAVNLEVNNTEDIEGLIDTIIKANNNLTDSNSRNDWEMMGSDIKTLQELIERLDKMRQENNKKTTATNTQSTQSTETK